MSAVFLLYRKEPTVQTNHEDGSHHVERSGTIGLRGEPDVVFPLFGPDREREWAEGWEPEALYPEVVAAREGTVFSTRHGGAEAVWVVNRYDEVERVVEYTTFRHEERVTRIRASVEEDVEREGWSVARVTYAVTALSERGVHMLEHFSEGNYDEMMKEWERAINHKLASRR